MQRAVREQVEAVTRGSFSRWLQSAAVPDFLAPGGAAIDWASVRIDIAACDPGLNAPFTIARVLPVRPAPRVGRPHLRTSLVWSESMRGYRMSCGFRQQQARQAARVARARARDGSAFQAASVALRETSRTAHDLDGLSRFCRASLAAFDSHHALHASKQVRRAAFRVRVLQRRHFHQIARAVLFGAEPNKARLLRGGVFTRDQRVQQQAHAAAQSGSAQQQAAPPAVAAAAAALPSRLVVLGMGDAGSGHQSALSRSQGAPVKKFTDFLQREYSSFVCGGERVRLVVFSLDEWMTSQVCPVCVRLNAKGRALAKAVSQPLAPEHRVLGGAGGDCVLDPTSGRPPKAHTLLACSSGHCPASAGASKWVVQRDHAAAENMANIAQCLALLAGGVPKAALPNPARAAVERAARVFRQVRGAVAACEPGAALG
jgi:hypothetical protein